MCLALKITSSKEIIFVNKGEAYVLFSKYKFKNI